MSLNVLVTAASRRVPLVQAFRRAVGVPPTGGAVIVTDVNPLSPAVHMADRAYKVSLVTAPEYLDELLGVCAAEEIGLLVPTIDDELPLLARARPRFEARGVRVAVSSRRTTTICNDKHATCVWLRSRGVPAAASYLPAGIPADAAFPLFVKPRFGRGGVGAYAVNTPRELEFFLSYVENPIVQQYLDGPEFTIDLLCDFGGRPLAVVPRERSVIRAGVTDRGRTVRSPDLVTLARRCAEAFDFAGAVNIQCRIVDGRPVVFEINPRFSGGIPLTIAAGADFPQMLVDLTHGRRIDRELDAFTDGLWMTSYESSIFLERPDGWLAERPVVARRARRAVA
jgi:carbamoyl-phosphate synthase large subunit